MAPAVEMLHLKRFFFFFLKLKTSLKKMPLKLRGDALHIYCHPVSSKRVCQTSEDRFYE